MMEPVYLIIQNIGYKGTFGDFLKIRDEIYWKWRDYRERNNIELKSAIWWTEILDTLKLQYTTSVIEQIILASHQKWRTQISLYPRVKEFLSDLKKEYIIVCISNIAEGDLAREDMDFFGILKIFDYVLMSSDLGIRKPSPKIFQHVLNYFHLEPNEMIFVGDTLYDDIQGAKDASLRMAIHIQRNRSYFFPDYYIEPDRVITNLQTIYEILNSAK